MIRAGVWISISPPHTNKQTDRQTDRQTNICTPIFIYIEDRFNNLINLFPSFLVPSQINQKKIRYSVEHSLTHYFIQAGQNG